MWDRVSKRIRVAEINASTPNYDTHTLDPAPAVVRELFDGVTLYPNIIDAVLPKQVGAEGLVKAAKYQHSHPSLQGISGGRLWLWTLKKDHLSCEPVGSLS